LLKRGATTTTKEEENGSSSRFFFARRRRLFVVQVVMCFFVRWKIYFVRLLNLRERNKNGQGAFKKI